MPCRAFAALTAASPRRPSARALSEARARPARGSGANRGSQAQLARVPKLFANQAGRARAGRRGSARGCCDAVRTTRARGTPRCWRRVARQCHCDRERKMSNFSRCVRSCVAEREAYLSDALSRMPVCEKAARKDRRVVHDVRPLRRPQASSSPRAHETPRSKPASSNSCVGPAKLTAIQMNS